MKNQIVKSLFMCCLLLLFINCSVKINTGGVLPALLSILKESEDDSDSDKKKVVKLKSSDFYTLTQDLGDLEDFKPEKEKKTVSFKKLGSNYVSPRILLESLGRDIKFEISSDVDLDFEIYHGISPLDNLSDKQKRIQKLGSSEDFTVVKKGETWTLESFTTGNYSLFLVSDSKNTITIKRVLEERKSLPQDSQEFVEVTENVKTFSAKLTDNSFLSLSGKRSYSYIGPQLAFNVKKGDRVFVYSSSKIGARWTDNYSSLIYWYRGSSAFKNKDDRLNRQMGCSGYCQGWPARWNYDFPDTVFSTTGSYSRKLYVSLDDKVESIEYQTVKISPYIPEPGTELNVVDDTFKSIEYVLDDRNTIFKTWTSNQWTLTGVRKGTVLKIQMHPTKSYKEILREVDYKDRRYSVLAQATFYTGTERLTKENASERFVPSYQMIDVSKYKFERNYKFGPASAPDYDYYNKITFNKTGDFSIVFTNYNKENVAKHKVKVDR